MYEAFFNLGNRPFLGAPCIERYFPAGAIEHARQALVRCIERGQGPGLLIGPSGTGKSLVCQMLADQFRSMFRVVVLANTHVSSRRALLQSILYELGLPYRDLDEGELRLSLAGHLEPSDDRPAGLLLIVDEADGLPLRLFDELRSLTNLARGGQPRVRLVLAGGAALEERFTHPKLESFNQRVAARCYLQPLNREETRHYIRSQIGSVGGNGDAIFPDAAAEAVFRATDGIPRLINQVCDAALLLAAQARQHVVDSRWIEHAWAELQQLPAPWQTADPESPSRTTTSVIEFGQLPDGDEPHGAVDSGNRSQSCDRSVTGETVAAPNQESPWPNSLDMPLGGVLVDAWLPDASRDAVQPSGGPEPASLAEPTRVVEPTRAVGPVRSLESTHGGAPTPALERAHASEDTMAMLKDPFGDGFSEEEVVSDPYAKMEADAIRARIRVSSPQGREIAWSLQNLGRTVADAEPSVVVRRVLPPRPLESQGGESPIGSDSIASDSDQGDSTAGHATGEPTSGDSTAIVDRPLHATRSTTNLVLHDASEATSETRPHIRLLPDDDRDLLVAEEEGARVANQPAEEGRVVRREYRQLFARLRRR